jgi:hypothetical protein
VFDEAKKKQKTEETAMKKFLILALVLIPVFIFAACGGGSGGGDAGDANTGPDAQTSDDRSSAETGVADPGQGEPGDTEPYARTEGRWSIDGAADTAAIEMDGIGGVTAYYASGAEEYSGRLDYYDEYGDGNGRYDIYDASDALIMGFYFDSKTRFHIGNDDDPVNNPVYIKLGTLPPGFVYVENEDYRYSGAGDPAEHMPPEQAAYILYEEELADIFKPGAYSEDFPIRITLIWMDDEGYRFAVSELPDLNPFHVGYDGAVEEAGV